MAERPVTPPGPDQLAAFRAQLAQMQDMLDAFARPPDDARSEITSVFDPTVEYLEEFVPDEEHMAIPEEVSPEILSVLGADPSISAALPLSVHEEVLSRWLPLLQTGPTKQQRTDLLNKYVRPPSLCSPCLNEELAAGLSEVEKRRDGRLMENQNLMGTALAAIGDVLSLFLLDSTDQVDRVEVSEKLADAAQAIAFNFHHTSKVRMSFIDPRLPKDILQALKAQRPAKYLYAENAAEKISQTRAVRKLGLSVLEKERPTQAKNARRPGGQRAPAPIRPSWVSSTPFRRENVGPPQQARSQSTSRATSTVTRPSQQLRTPQPQRRSR